MRALSSFLGMLASIATLGAIAVRVWWSKPRPTPQDWAPDNPPKAPSWLRTAAKWWLITVVFGATIIFLIVVIYTIISLS
jgi:hypothetical protein